MAVIVETLMGEDLELGIATTTKTHPAGGTLNGHQISIATFAIGGVAGGAIESTWSPGAIASNGIIATTVLVSGAAVGDKVLASFPIGSYNLMLSAHVSDTNEVTVILGNMTGAVVDPGTGTLSILVFRSPVASAPSMS